jgi:hypothetical protein
MKLFEDFINTQIPHCNLPLLFLLVRGQYNIFFSNTYTTSRGIENKLELYFPYSTLDASNETPSIKCRKLKILGEL